MRKYILFFFVLPLFAQAGNGDSTVVRVTTDFHMNRYGNFDFWSVMPPTSHTSNRAFLKFTLGCLSNGQCEWDYTLRLFVRERTGLKDSTLKQAPSFRVNGQVRDSVMFRNDTTYVTSFNTTTKKTDSVASATLLVVRYTNTALPLQPTDSLRVWPAGYYNYYFDTTGVKTDSVWVSETTKLKLINTPYYDVFDVINDIEVGRFISPYAKTFPKTFKYDYVFDVTDYQALLHDSVQFRIQYQGYSYGFTATTDFIFIEGTPARKAYKVQNVYSGGFPYGRANNSIENYLTQKSFTVPQDAASVKVRVWITGHGGEQNENCAEFCAKYYYLKVNNQSIASQLVWKADCGSNAIINQPGTWIYNRANWCPGEVVPTYDYALNVSAGSTNTIDMDMEPFIANGDASYNIAVQLFYYMPYTATTDLGVEDIIAPSTDFWYNRVNPVCDNARIKIKNYGSVPVTRAKIHYQIGNAKANMQEWSGSLASEKSTEVTLQWLIWPSDFSDKTFKVWLTDINGATDDEVLNNSKTTQFQVPQIMPRRVIIETRTNLRPEHNSYTVKDSRGNVLRNRTFTQSGTLHRDTFEFSIGCYTFRFNDEGGNGLNFWATPSDGSGSVRFITAQSPIQVLKTFNADFGSFLQFHFTSEFSVAVNDAVDATDLVLYPNPVADFVNLKSEHLYLTKVKCYSVQGQLIHEQYVTDAVSQIPTAGWPTGVYIVKAEDANGNVFTKRITKVSN
ncbi:MAG: peptide-N-glycosidase F-related protein [Bacteroidota bacterium]